MAVLAFRGTEPARVRDLVTDADAFRTRCPAGGTVHRGFFRAYGQVDTEVGAAVAELPDRRLFITGHSLGGALATLAALRLVNQNVPIAAVYTYGSPRVGDAAFKRAYNEPLGRRTFRHKNNNDVVTRVPLALPTCAGQALSRVFRLPFVPGGYRHVGRLIYYDADGDLYEHTTWWFRLLDALDGRLRELGRLGPDGLKDHSMRAYVDLARCSVETSACA